MKKMAWLVAILLLAGAAQAGTIAYWEFDGAAYDGRDAVGSYDLTLAVGDGGVDSGLRADPVPNPDISMPWSGMDSAASNPKASWFSQDAWYIPNSSVEAEHDATFDLDPTKSFTAEGWFRPYNASGTIIGVRHGVNMLGGAYKGWSVYTTSSGAALNFIADGAAATGSSVLLTTPVTNNELQHFAAVYDKDAGTSGKMYLYVNGVLQQQADVPDTWSFHRGGPLAIGARDAGAGLTSLVFAGAIDELRYVDMALTPEYFLNGDTPLPEPATLALLAVGGLALRRRK